MGGGGVRAWGRSALAVRTTARRQHSLPSFESAFWFEVLVLSQVCERWAGRASRWSPTGGLRSTAQHYSGERGSWQGLGTEIDRENRLLASGSMWPQAGEEGRSSTGTCMRGAAISFLACVSDGAFYHAAVDLTI